MDVKSVKTEAAVLRNQAKELSASIRLDLQKRRTACLRADRVAKGLCPTCGKVKKEATYRCGECNSKATASAAKRLGRFKGRDEWAF